MFPVPPLCQTQLTSSLKYKSPHATDLSFAKDEKQVWYFDCVSKLIVRIRVTGQSDDDEDWLLGESLDGSRSGGFPKVSKILPARGRELIGRTS